MCLLGNGTCSLRRIKWDYISVDRIWFWGNGFDRLSSRDQGLRYRCHCGEYVFFLQVP